MGIWKPEVRVESNRVLELNRGNPAVWTYTLEGGKTFPPGTTATLTLKNTYNQVIGEWPGLVTGGMILFSQTTAIADSIPRGTSWTLNAVLGGVTPRMFAQGTVVRNEAPMPDAPPQSSEFDGVRYQYSFGTPGFLVDPAWRILNGHPRVYDNSSRTLPNAVAVGSLQGGDLTLYDDVSMLWFAPLAADPVRLTYNTIRSSANSNGEMWTVICSNYDMTNWAGFRHRQVFGIGKWDSDTIEIVTGSGPVTFVTRETIEQDTVNNQNYTAEFNPISNTYALYLGDSHEPLISWPDTTNIVNHGEGERYVGFGFQSDFAAAGVQCSDWIIADTP